MGGFRHLNRDVRLLLVTTFLFGHNVYGVFLLLLNLYLVRLGYDSRFIGLLNGAGLLTIALCSVPAGLIGARWGLRRTMVGGLLLMAACGNLMPLGETAGGLRGTWLLSTSALAILGGTLYAVNATPFLMAVASPAERNQAFALVSALSPLSSFVGSLVGGALPPLFGKLLHLPLTEPAPYRYPIQLAALLLVPGALALLGTRDVLLPREPAGSTERKGAPWPAMAAMALVVILRYAGRGPAATFFNLYLDVDLNLPTTVVGALTAAGHLASGPAALIAPLCIAGLGLRGVIFWGALGLAGTLLPLALVPHWAAAAVGIISNGALFSITAPAITVYHQQIVPPAWRPVMSGTINMAVGLGQAAMALGGGYIIAARGFPALFLAGVALSIASGLCFRLAAKRPRCLSQDERELSGDEKGMR